MGLPLQYRPPMNVRNRERSGVISVAWEGLTSMNTQRIRTMLMGVLGQSLTARIHGIRFAYRMRKALLADPEAELIPRFTKAGDVAIDVGANNANWTYRLHLNVGNAGRVFAFEADPYYALATHHALRIIRMKGVQLFKFGLSDKEEKVPLRVSDTANQRVSGLGYIDKNAKKDDVDVTLVHLKTLDSLIPEYPELLRTSFLKCDVEGYELFVLKGSQQVLSKARPVVVLEIGHYEKHGYSAREMYDFFKERDYEPFAMVQGGKLASTDAWLRHDAAVGVNRVLIPIEKVPRVQDIVRPSTLTTFR
jgi:FkbM family methyltransferase